MIFLTVEIVEIIKSNGNNQCNASNFNYNHERDIITYTWTSVLDLFKQYGNSIDVILVMDSDLNNNESFQRSNYECLLAGLPVYDVQNEKDRINIIRLVTHTRHRTLSEIEESARHERYSDMEAHSIV